MAEEKTYVCPNCGKRTTNSENCENCGSLLVRFVEKGIDVKETPYKDDSLLVPGLIKELETNLKLQEKYNNGVFVYTEISWLEESLIIYNYNDLYEIPDDTIPEKPQLVIDFNLWYRNESNWLDKEETLIYNKKLDAFLMRFTQLRSYPLFSFKENERGIDESFYYKHFFLNCDQDVKGAARIISEVLIKVMGLSLSDNYKIETGYDDENEDDIAVSTYHSKSQEISDMDNTGGQNNQATVVDSIDELKKGKEEKSRNNIAKYVCSVCGYTHEGSVPPEKCPVCLASASEFSEIQEEVVVEEAKEEVKDESVDSDNITNSELNDVVINEVNTTHEEDKSIKEEEKPCEVANLNLNYCCPIKIGID